MSLLPDVAALRRLAASYAERATTIRAEADRLVAHADATPWVGASADALRHGARATAGSLRRTAGAHDDVAAALEEHARQVEVALVVVAEIRQRFVDLASSVGARVVDLAGVVVGGAVEVAGELAEGAAGLVGIDLGDDDEHLREQIERVDVPPAGHADWLTIDLPGMS